jgi:hypothetical protein
MLTKPLVKALERQLQLTPEFHHTINPQQSPALHTWKPTLHPRQGRQPELTQQVS